MTKRDPAIPSLKMNSCPLLNISECAISANSQNFISTVYNPLSRPVNYVVRLPVSGTAYSVKNPQGVELPNQIVPIPESLKQIPGRVSTTSLELVFIAESVPPLGYRSYYISAVASTEGYESTEQHLEESEDITIGSDKMKISVSGSSRLMSSLSYEGKTTTLNQNLEYYKGSFGNNDGAKNRASGAYIFRPLGNHSEIITSSVNSSVYNGITFKEGPIVIEIHQVFSSWASQVIRLYKDEFYAEVEWLVGPIPTSDFFGKEIISRYSTTINNRGVFFTDSNGRQTIKRQRDYRSTWNVDIREPIAGNYYPITTDISINDGELEFTVLVDRAEGGSSLGEGEIELMLHRRLLYDDGFGVDEALNEEAYGTGLVARGQHWIMIGNLSDPNWSKQKRMLQQEKVLRSQIFLTEANELDFDKWFKTYKLEHSGLTTALPPSVQILTLEPWKGKTYLLRLEHIFDNSEVKEPVTVNLSNLFSAFDIVSVKETSLGADRWLNEISRLKWRKETNEVFDEDETTVPIESSFPQVTLKPKEIRTFICDIKPKSVI